MSHSGPPHSGTYTILHGTVRGSGAPCAAHTGPARDRARDRGAGASGAAARTPPLRAQRHRPAQEGAGPRATPPHREARTRAPHARTGKQAARARARARCTRTRTSGLRLAEAPSPAARRGGRKRSRQHPPVAPPLHTLQAPRSARKQRPRPPGFRRRRPSPMRTRGLYQQSPSAVLRVSRPTRLGPARATGPTRESPPPPHPLPHPLPHSPALCHPSVLL